MRKFYLILLFFIFLSVDAFSQAIKITVSADLDFDDVIQMQSKDIPKTSSKAAKFKIVSNADRWIRVELILPSNFTNGGYNAPVAFSTTRTAWNYANNASTSTNFNPLSYVWIEAEEDEPIYVWVGGILSPTTSSEPGNYTGVITLKVTSY